MRTRQIILIIATACLAWLPAWTAPITSKAMFQTEMKRVEAEADQRRAALFEGFFGLLKRMADQYRDQGDMDMRIFVQEHMAEIRESGEVLWTNMGGKYSIFEAGENKLRELLVASHKRELVEQLDLIEAYTTHLMAEKPASPETTKELQALREQQKILFNSTELTKGMHLGLREEQIREVRLNGKSVATLRGNTVRVGKATRRPLAPGELPPPRSTPTVTVVVAPPGPTATPAPPAVFQPSREQQLRLQNAVVNIEAGDARGTGFFATMGGVDYLITNLHVVMTSAPIKVVTMGGKPILLKSVEVAGEEDIARFRFEAPQGYGNLRPLEVASEAPLIGTAIVVYGNSEGSGAATLLQGNVNGVGPAIIEVSAGFVPGNSGSPIVDADMRVLGVASYVQRAKSDGDWVKKGTRFEQARRFAYRLSTDTPWKGIPPDVFRRQAQWMEDFDTYLYDLVSIIGNFQSGSAGAKGQRPYRVQGGKPYESIQGFYANKEYARNIFLFYQTHGKAPSKTNSSLSDREIEGMSRHMLDSLLKHFQTVAADIRRTPWFCEWLAQEGEYSAAFCDHVADYLANQAK